MSPFPAETKDRWGNREETGSGKGTIYWHILLGESPVVRAIARKTQARLAAFKGFHMTPEQWLHATALVAGTTDDISFEELELMLSEAKDSLSQIQPINVTIDKVLYHPEAIMLGFTPERSLEPIHTAVRHATEKVTGRAGTVTGPTLQWTPHVTVSYSTAEQPMEPIVAVLGREVPKGDLTIDAVTLVIQWGPERLWDWQPVGTASLASGKRSDRNQ